MIVHNDFDHKIQNLDQLKCPTNEMISKLWYIHVLTYYMAIKRSKLLLHSIIHMSLKIFTLNKNILVKNNTYCRISAMKF